MDNKRKCVFAGTFDPPTLGHKALIEDCLRLFDEVVVLIARNPNKTCLFSEEARREFCEKTFADLPNVRVDVWEGIVVDYARKVGATALLRGVRSVKDFEYERDLADINMRIDGMETIILISAPEYAVVSSSLVRELAAHGKDVSEFLP